MVAEALVILAREGIALSGAIIAVLLVRLPTRATFGPRLAYALWLAIPAALALAALPAPTSAKLLPPAVAATTPSAVPMAGGLATATQAVYGAIDPALLLVCAWALGAIAFSLVVLSRQRQFVASLGRLRADRRFGVEVLEAERGDISPAVIGAFRPRIILPAGFAERFDEAAQELIIAHELAHLRAWDPQLNAAAVMLQCLFWFNPLVHIAVRPFRLDQELACDAAVMNALPAARRMYAEAMLATQMNYASAPIGCHWPAPFKTALSARVTALARPSPGPGRRLLGTAVLALAAAAAGYSAWAAQPPRPSQSLKAASATSARTLGRALVDAAGRRDIANVRELVARGADIDAAAVGDGTPLIAAARTGNLAMVRFLVELGADVNAPLTGDGNPLIAAAGEGHVRVTGYLLEHGASIDAIVPGDETALITAARAGEFDVVRQLVRAGADPNLAVDVARPNGARERRSPLGEAGKRGHADVARYLATAGARP